MYGTHCHVQEIGLRGVPGRGNWELLWLGCSSLWCLWGPSVWWAAWGQGTSSFWRFIDFPLSLKESFHPLIHFPNDRNSYIRANLETGSQKLLSGLPHGYRLSSATLPNHRIGVGNGAAPTQTNVHMDCRSWLAVAFS